MIEHANSPLTKRMHTWYKTIAPENEVTRLFAKLKKSHDVINIIKWLKRIHLEIWRFGDFVEFEKAGVWCAVIDGKK
jgi:hypothetical protein